MPDYMIGPNRFESRPLAPGLYVVATPIGNLCDITLRALETLAGADLVACEDTRITARLLNRYAIQTPMTAYHEHNADRIGPTLIRRIADGASIALVSDAGTPLVSDPGFRLVHAARDAGIPVVPIPGASAAIAALSASGLPTESFHFAGFLPSKQAQRSRRLKDLATLDATLVFYESPNRLSASLADIAAILGAGRRVAICRELTKLHEEFTTGDAGALAHSHASKPVKGEVVLLVAPPDEAPPIDVDALLDELLERMSVSRAAAEAARMSGLAKRDLYARALELDRQRKQTGRETGGHDGG